MASSTREASLEQITDDEFDAFRRLIYDIAGIHLHEGKRTLVTARLSKRLRALNMPTFLDYYDHLLNHDPLGHELQQMINCITTNKTEFFRESHHFDFLKETAIPEICAEVGARRSRKLRIWSAACSLGQEPYSIAMAVLDALNGAQSWDIRILASDIDTNVLDHASQGMYPADEIARLPAAMKQKYFLKGTGQWKDQVRVKPAVQRLVTFRQINLNATPWPIHTQFDLIFCRNVIIYFDQPTQMRLFGRLHEIIRPNGYLMLGHSENLPFSLSGYRSLGGTIYRVQP
ncbi:MAG TPA: protein-glutamate O-methyltransferase CheR [Pirellulaceae bacterium]|nr:protein-glutamate O-methyltransferase CheR [Pirellulaceae bacterium]